MKTIILLKTVRGTSYEKHTILGQDDRGDPEKHPYYDTFRIRKNNYEIWVESRTIAYLQHIPAPAIIIRIVHNGKQYSEQYFVGVHCKFTIEDLDTAMLKAKGAVEEFLNSINSFSDIEAYLPLKDGVSYSYINEQNHFFKEFSSFELPWETIK